MIPETIELFIQGDEDLPVIKLTRIPKTSTVREVVEAARAEGLPVAANHEEAVVLLEGGEEARDLDRCLEDFGIGHHHRLRYRRHVNITVNRKPVVLHHRTATGAQIKQAAITQRVGIETDFPLFEVTGASSLKPIGDAETVTLHEHEQFRATAPDDNS